MAGWWSSAASGLSTVAANLASASASVADKLTTVAGDINIASVADGLGEMVASVKQTVEATAADFERENAAFVASKPAHERTRRLSDSEAVPPWVGLHREAELRDKILALSADKRNFTMDPPEDTQFAFDLGAIAPVAHATAKYDARLEKMRYSLVPRQMDDARFWRNYFYRVFLIKQAAQLEEAAELASLPEPTEAPADDSASQPTDAEAAAPTAQAASDPQSPAPPPAASTDEWLESLKEDLESLGVADAELINVSVVESVPNATTAGDVDWELELERELHDLENS